MKECQGMVASDQAIVRLLLDYYNVHAEHTVQMAAMYLEEKTL